MTSKSRARLNRYKDRMVQHTRADIEWDFAEIRKMLRKFPGFACTPLAGVNTSVFNYCSLLHGAICKRYYGFAEELLAMGVDPDFSSHGAHSPIYFAARINGDTRFLKLLLDYGADVNIRNEDQCPIRAAIEKANLEAFELLLDVVVQDYVPRHEAKKLMQRIFQQYHQNTMKQRWSQEPRPDLSTTRKESLRMCALLLQQGIPCKMTLAGELEPHMKSFREDLQNRMCMIAILARQKLSKRVAIDVLSVDLLRVLGSFLYS